jgi:hypothetical protein
VIRGALRAGQVIPFLGAGASLGGRKAGAPRQRGEHTHLPTGAALGRYLAMKTRFPRGELRELTRVAQYYDAVNGRELLYRDLRSVFARDYSPSPLHACLAKLRVPLLIVTTNYDDLIERAFDSAGRPYDTVIHTTDPNCGDKVLWWKHGEPKPEQVIPNKLNVDLGSTTLIYKMHGAVDRHNPTRDQYVITEDDYIDFLARMTRNKAVPAIFAEPFQTRSFLFLGYALRDWNLRVVLNRIEKDLRRPKTIKSWAIQRSPSPLEQRFWRERGVEVFDITIDDFVRRLC